ncbi:aminopeptidase P family protein [Celeribacter arenosi]|uniref:Aminopeptidase P family protein n=1 Tax=Celeribacter arenosi TaxID=792649 RepID=A0ABP7JTS2_9RHOB
MFQSFNVTSRPDQAAPRVTALRAEMAQAGLDAYLVPRADAHQGETVADCDDRLAWLTGFTGSAGSAVIGLSQAALFTDGRYTVQVRAQCDPALFEFIDWPATKPVDWLKKTEARRIGFDPWLHTVAEIRAIRKALTDTDAELVAGANLVDRIWADRPAPPAALAVAQSVKFTGRTSDDKLDEIRESLKKSGADAAVLTLPDSISWLLNIRGSDIAHTPVVQAFAIIPAEDKLSLFANPAKFADLPEDPRISIYDDAALAEALSALEGRVLVDPASAPHAVVSLLTKADVVEGTDPCQLPKARKTPQEIEGTREAHLRDGAAMVEFLAWLSDQAVETLSEIDVVKKLEGFRRATNALKDISFETICGSGPNGAIVHYRVSEETNRPLAEGELLLIDSGGQYVDGTTDITRTVALGDIGADEREAFTAVLQGMIAISAARFPKGITGAHLDALARSALWRQGRDYDHGTGHGVGAYLSVHEGPQRLSRVSDVALEEGMILSNEPGYYREGAFGIRIENLIVVQPAQMPPGSDKREMFEFETLTFVPIDRNLIHPDALAPWERDWIDEYHALVWDRISPRLSDDARAWLREAVAPL